SVSTASGQRGQDLQKADAARSQSGRASVANGSAGLSRSEECAGRVLSARAIAWRRQQGDRGNGAQDRGAGVSDAEVWPGVRASKSRGVRVGVSAASRKSVGEEGRESGLQAGAGDDERVRGICARKQPIATRP